MDVPRVTELDWRCHPLELAAAWPPDRPLMMLHSGRVHRRWARWSILASPESVEPLTDLNVLECTDRPDTGDTRVPFVGGWIGYVGYDLGRGLEPAACTAHGAVDDRHWPAGERGWCPDALVCDNLRKRWYAVGRPPSGLELAESVGGSFVAGTPRSVVDVDAYLDTVARVIEYIGAGDVFQVNVTHRLSASFAGSTRHLALRALELSGAWYGAYLELPGGRCVVSLSPELFVELNGRQVVTRPIKGTRPGQVEPRELLDSAKDTAELTMIVDLMRNDLGRVSEYGSVRVPRPRVIETHPTVHHGVAEVTARLRPDVEVGGLLRATFPAGSVTGAPKIRAMQIIDELEAVRRGPYCGSAGFVSVCGRAAFNVAIRTMVLSGTRRAGDWGSLEGVLDYGVGGGIVADSEPVSEYRESMDKAAILTMVLASVRPRRPAAGRAAFSVAGQGSGRSARPRGAGDPG